MQQRMAIVERWRVVVSVICLVCFAVLSAVLPADAMAQTVERDFPQAREFFPGADRFADFSGSPRAAAAYRGETLLGYVFLTDDVVRVPAYSGKPVNLLVGLDASGTITGAEVLEHHEPILLVGIPEQKLFDFAAQYVGKSVGESVRVGGSADGSPGVDAISGATVTAMVVNQSIMRGARKIASSRGIGPSPQSRASANHRVREDVFRKADWPTLVEEGSIGRLYLDFAAVDHAFRGTKGEGKGPRPDSDCGADDGDDPCDRFIDLYYGYLNAPTIGRNLLGDFQYEWLMRELKPGEHAIAVLADGVFSFKGSGYVRGGIFDRIQVVQGDVTVTFRDLDHHRLSDLFVDRVPDFNEMAIFIVRETAGFDPGAPWHIELLVSREVGPLERVFSRFRGDYRLPAAYLSGGGASEPPVAAAELEAPMWKLIWQDKIVQIAVLGVALGFLTGVLFLQDWLVRRAHLFRWVRNGFLVFTVGFVGWYAIAQLSIVNVLTFTNAVFHGFMWDTFLLDPLMFILWSFVALTLLLWGRGVYCGWLCPFGALQELLNKSARHLGVVQLNLPEPVHERLWAIKYIVLMILFGISLHSLAQAERFAEIEPFKTAIVLKFERDWPFVAFAAALLLVSLFNRKFYCKYLCPLGAALAVPGRLRLFDWWLRRRKECGKPCQVCAVECEVQAIRPTGEINASECHFCLDCQATYWNDRKCPPLVERGKRKARKQHIAARPRDDVGIGVSISLEKKNS